METLSLQYPLFRQIAEHSLLVEFGDAISHEIHDRVLGLDRALNAAPFDGFRESVPAYAAVLIHFDPLHCDHAQAEIHVRHLLTQGSDFTSESSAREVEVCYDGDDVAPDLAAVAQQTGLSTDAVINAHMAGAYDVFMYGFAPGCAYLAGVPQMLHMPRKAAAVRNVAAGSVLIAGPQCLVTTLVMPTGWWIIGRSPTRILTGDDNRPFLFDVGDRVTFRRITRAAYDAGRQA